MKGFDLYQRPTGDVSRRLMGVRKILRQRIQSAFEEAATHHPDSPFAASLRGKARGYREAIELIERLDGGRRLRGHRWERRA